MISASPPAAKPANTPASPRFSSNPSPVGASGSTSPDTTNATLRSSSPHRPCPPMKIRRPQDFLVVKRQAFAHLMKIRRQPLVHPVTICAIQLGLRQPFIKPQESILAAVASFKIGPPAALRLRHHRCPTPQALPLAPPPGLPVSPHLIKSSHQRRLAARHTGGAPCHPPPHRLASLWRHNR